MGWVVCGALLCPNHHRDLWKERGVGRRPAPDAGMDMMRRPRLMPFGEPTAGLSPKLADEVLGKIKHMRDDSTVANMG